MQAVFEKLDIGPTGSIGLAHLHGALTQCKYINKDEEVRGCLVVVCVWGGGGHHLRTCSR